MINNGISDEAVDADADVHFEGEERSLYVCSFIHRGGLIQLRLTTSNAHGVRSAVQAHP